MESNKNNISDDLLVKYLLGEATGAEQQDVREWISISDANKKHFEHFKLIWEESKKIAATSTVNVDDAWSGFKERRNNAESGPVRVMEFPARRLNWIRAAAILILVVGAGWLVYTLSINNGGQLMAVNSGNTVLVDTLPDGSVVTLNKNSSLSYNSKFDGHTRSVKLEGEAFFNVAPDKEHPFVIDVNGTTVTVVGTSFNIKSTEEKTEVIVATGIVEVEKNKNTVKLRQNEKATVMSDGDAPVKGHSTDDLYNYYKTKEFICRGTRLPRLVEVLNEAYSTDIVIQNNRLEYQEINTTFSYQSLNEILEVLEKQYNIQAIKEGNRIILQ